MPATPQLDLTQRVDTPEGSSLPLTPASPLQRSVAWLLDLGVRILISILASMVTDLLGDIGIGLQMLTIFLVNWWYMVLFEVLNLGVTPGKRAMGLRVVQLDGSPPDWSHSLLRNLLRVIDMLPFGYTLGTAVALTSPRFQRLGDMVAGTLVIHEAKPLMTEEAAPVPAVQFLRPLRGEEQHALLSFDERHTQLTAARRLELAELLAGPLGLEGEQPDLQLRRIAAGLRGEA